MSAEGTPLSLALRRLLKKIQESPVDQLKPLFRELPPADESTPELFSAVLALTARTDLASFVFSYIERTDADRYTQDHFERVVSWADEYGSGFDESLFKKYVDWLMRRVYKGNEMKPENANTRFVVKRFTAWFGNSATDVLSYFSSESRVFDLWIACSKSDEKISIAHSAVTLDDAQLLGFFNLLANQHSQERSRGGLLEDRPWLEITRLIWDDAKQSGGKIAKAFIRAWRHHNSDETGITDFMFEMIDKAEEPLRSTMKAAMYSFAVPFTQYLAKKSATPLFDPVLCFVIVNSAAEDEMYGAVKWAMEMADPTKLPTMIDVVVALIANSKGSVLRRLPSFFLMAGQLHDLWEQSKSAEAAEAMKRLARYWTSYREQFQKESVAEQQSHYFSSNAELVEEKMGKVLVRTQS